MIIHSFDQKTKELIRPEMMVRRSEDFPKFFLSSFSGLFTKKIMENYSPKEIGRIHLARNITIHAIEHEGKTMGYLESPMGAPAAVIAEEELFSMGAESILYFGSCGFLDPSMRPLSFFIPEECYRDEGTSYHYAPPSDFIAVPTAGRLKSVFQTLSLPYESGRIWTTDGFFRETRGNAEKKAALGCRAVDMECSALMAAAAFREKKAYQFLFSADYLKEDYDPGILSHLPGSSADSLVETAVLVLHEIMEGEE